MCPPQTSTIKTHWLILRSWAQPAIKNPRMLLIMERRSISLWMQINPVIARTHMDRVSSITHSQHSSLETILTQLKTLLAIIVRCPYLANRQSFTIKSKAAAQVFTQSLAGAPAIILSRLLASSRIVIINMVKRILKLLMPPALLEETLKIRLKCKLRTISLVFKSSSSLNYSEMRAKKIDSRYLEKNLTLSKPSESR